MEPLKSNPQILSAIWRDRNGWAYKIETHFGKRAVWQSSGFETKAAAEANMKEVLAAIEKGL